MNAIAIRPNVATNRSVRRSPKVAVRDHGPAPLVQRVVNGGIESLSPADLAVLIGEAQRSGLSAALVAELRDPNAPAVVRERITGLIGRRTLDGETVQRPVAA